MDVSGTYLAVLDMVESEVLRCRSASSIRNQALVKSKRWPHIAAMSGGPKRLGICQGYMDV